MDRSPFPLLRRCRGASLPVLCACAAWLVQLAMPRGCGEGGLHGDHDPSGEGAGLDRHDCCPEGEAIAGTDPAQAAATKAQLHSAADPEGSALARGCCHGQADHRCNDCAHCGCGRNLPTVASAFSPLVLPWGSEAAIFGEPPPWGQRSRKPEAPVPIGRLG